MLGSPAIGLTLSKYLLIQLLSLKNKGPHIHLIHLSNINKMINIGLGNIECLICGN